MILELAARDPLAVSALARVEVPAALWRKTRIGELAPEDARVLTLAFEADWTGSPDTPARFMIAGFRAGIGGTAARLCETHPLAAYDAVQLATAIAVRTADPHTAFACFDTRLRKAAAREGFEIVPRSVG